MSIKGNPYARFRRSLETRRLSVVLLAAAELPHIQLDDALEILILMAQEHDPRFDRAAARWVGRLLAETPTGLADGRYAPPLVERLPHGAESLRRLARRRKLMPSRFERRDDVLLPRRDAIGPLPDEPAVPISRSRDATPRSPPL